MDTKNPELEAVRRMFKNKVKNLNPNNHLNAVCDLPVSEKTEIDVETGKKNFTLTINCGENESIIYSVKKK